MDELSYIRFFAAFLFVIALIALAAWGARRYGFAAKIGGKPRAGKRLHLVESLPLDGKSRAVILRRDDVEHLIVIGEGGARILERDIAASQAKGSGNPQ